MKYKIREYISYYWTIWAKALGDKAHHSNPTHQMRSDRYADKVAVIRTLIVLFYIITNIFIIAGVIRQW
jgi:hypothetical protein